MNSGGRGDIVNAFRCVCYVTKIYFVGSFGVGVSDVLQSSGESGMCIGSICRTLSTHVSH